MPQGIISLCAEHRISPASCTHTADMV